MDSEEFRKEPDFLDGRLRRTGSAGISSAEGTPAAADDQTSRYAAVAGHDRISIDAVRGRRERACAVERAGRSYSPQIGRGESDRAAALVSLRALETQ